MTSNLPPGCTVAEIPGNTKLDEQWEKAWDDLADRDIQPEELTQAVKLFINMRDSILGEIMFCEIHGTKMKLICPNCEECAKEIENEQ